MDKLMKIFPEVDEKFLEEQLAASADREQVERSIEILSQQALPELSLSSKLQKEAVLSLLAIFGGSSFLSRFLLQNFEVFVRLIRSSELHTLKSHDRFRKEAAALSQHVGDFEQLCRLLRRYKYEQVLRIAIRDLRAIAPIEEITAELSHLASACTDAAYRVCRRLLDPEGILKEPFVVLGMGKLGGEELNFSSDIDLIFLYDAPEPNAPLNKKGIPSTAHAYFVRLAERITKALNTITPDGIVWRVDLRLRPEGSRGPICHSVRSAQDYYESWGETWERAALFKGRPIAGDLELGWRFLKQLEPWLYRRYLDYATIEDIQLLKQKIDREVATSSRKEWDLKLGIGGIREIEFFIQTIQLVNAGKNRHLRERNTLKALAVAGEQKCLDGEIAEKLSSAYRFYRKMEHRIQMVEERQTQRLPSDPKDLEKLAVRSGFSNSTELLNKIESQRETVHAIFRTLLSDERRKEGEKVDPMIDKVFAGEISKEEATHWLRKNRFSNPEAALKHIALLREGPPHIYFTAKARRAFEKLGPQFLDAASKSPDPSQSLIHLERFLTAVGSRGGIYSLLLENPKTLRFLIQLFGSSTFLSNFLIQRVELLDSLVMRGYAQSRKDCVELRKELNEALDRFSDKEDRLNAFRQFRNGEMLRIGLNDLWGELGIVGVATQLSDLADVTLEKVLEMAEQDAQERFRSRPNMAIFALGKLGGRELNYHSDLDLLFVYPDRSSPEACVLAAQRVLSYLSTNMASGYLYKPDTRLRPSGKSGPLAVSVKAFKDYYSHHAAVWERLALTRLRWVVGNESLRNAITGVVQSCVVGWTYTDDDWREVDRIRRRIEKELAQERGGKYNPKLGRGGLIDIEFLVQRLQLEAGFAEPNTLDGIERLVAANALEASTGASLREHYLFLRRLENRLRIVSDFSLLELPVEGESLERVARRMDYVPLKGKTPGQRLIEEYRKRTEEVRKIYKVFFLSPRGRGSR